MQSKLVTRTAVLMAALICVDACSTLSSVKDEFFGGSKAAIDPVRIDGFIGAAVSDEPRASLAGRETLALGGSAADAAVSVGMTLAVTYPSRAGLGSGGACIAFNPDRNGPGGGAPEVILFPPVAPRGIPGGADRPAAVPMLARGLFALHARHGRLPFEGLLAGPEQMAKFGVPVSRALVRDIAVVAGPLSADPNARAVFTPRGVPLAEGAQLLQPDLGSTIAQLRTAGVGDLYQGTLARRLVDASRLAGGPLSLDELRTALPRTGAPITIAAGRDLVAFLPPPADGGLAAAAAFRALQQNPSDAAAAQARAMAAIQSWRAGGTTVQAAMEQGGASGPMPPPAASTGFTVLDRNGVSVTCVLTMDNLFGTGRIAPGTGIVLAAAPGPSGLPLLAAATAYNTSLHAFRASVAGSGQEGAALAVAVGMTNILRSNAPLQSAVTVPEPGRANAIACTRYLPDNESSCAWATDPRGAGLAASSN